MIRAERLTKRFGRVPAVADLSFEVAAGEVLGFLGPNGAGKTTTLRVLAGYWPPTSGKASIAGFDLLERSLDARRRLGYVPEQFAAPAELRVGEYLRFRALLKGLDRAGARRRVGEVCGLLGLEERRRQTCGSLSKGFRQRVGLADALLASPPVLLLDEPFSGLDPLQRAEFRELLRRLAAEGCAILFSSHVLPEVEGLAHRLLILHRGRACAVGTRAELLGAAAGEGPLRLVTAADPGALAAALLADPALAAACPVIARDGGGLTIRPASAEGRARLLHWLGERGEPVTEFRLLEPTLEDLFHRLLGAAPPPRQP